MSWPRFMHILCILLLMPAAALAQRDTATVIGTVTDAQGGLLPGVTVTANNVETGFTLTGVTDSEGRYRIAAIPPGRYEFRAELQGFALSLRRGVTLSLGSESVLNFSLKLAGVTEQVTVTADSPVVETTTAAVQTNISREQIDLLPLIGRNYQSLLRLAPGAQSSNGLSFAGSRGRSNQWHIDGVDNSEDISGYSRQEPALESIGEVQIVTAGFKAEYGQASGGIINVVTRSGTNNFDGNAFFLYRDQDLMSRDPYADRDLPKDPFQRIHYGGTIGGPVVRDKLHFFATYEREDRDTFSDSTRTLPSRNSNFSPATLQFLQSNGIDLSFFPDIPAGTTQRVRQVRPEFVDVHKTVVRVDNQISGNQFLTFRYTMDRDSQPSGTSGTLLDFNGATSLFRTNYGTVNHKWILGSNKLNELYVQFGQTYGNWYVSYPNLTNLSISGGPSIGGPTNYPQGRTDYVYQVNDNFTWTMAGTRTGEHTVKAGAQIKVFKSDSFFDSNFRGIYTFPSLSRFLSGRPSRFTQNQGDTTLARPNEIYGFYLQDDWRLNQALTLNLGLRYDFEAAKTQALRDVTGEPGPGISGDKNNISPRAGFAWAPGGSTRHVIYGGTGLYYDQIILNIVGNARFTPPKVIGIQIDNPGFPDPFGGEIEIPRPNVSIIDPDLITGREWSSQIGYRRELLPDLGLDVNYVYKRGEDHVGILNANAGTRGSASIFGGGADRPNPDFTNINFYTNFGEIRYHGLNVELRKRFSHNFLAHLAYTLSKTEDNAFNFVSDIDYPELPELSYGPGSDDRRHVMTGSVAYRLPFDIQLGTIVEFRTEAPLDITASRDINGDGLTGEWVHQDACVNIECPGFTYSRNSVREVSLEEANALRALFDLDPIERFENNPKYFNVDLTLQKRIGLPGDQGVRLTVEAFNVFNLPQRNQPSQSITSSLFGQITGVDQPRAVQFTLQYDW